jgi:hypothetical protein
MRGRKERMSRNTVQDLEVVACEACQLVPLTHLSLDLDPPLDGWPEFFAERNIEVAEDDLGRPSVARRVLAELLAEREVEEARVAAQRAEQAAALRTPVLAGVPAQEESSALESMMMAPGYVSAREELGNGRVSVTQELLDERLAEGQRQAAEQRAEAELLDKARRVLDGRDK